MWAEQLSDSGHRTVIYAEDYARAKSGLLSAPVPEKLNSHGLYVFQNPLTALCK